MIFIKYLNEKTKFFYNYEEVLEKFIFVVKSKKSFFKPKNLDFLAVGSNRPQVSQMNY